MVTTGEAVVVRAGRRADAAALARVFVASWRAAYRGLMPDAALGALTVADARARWKAVFRAADRTVLVAESGGRIRGVAAFGPCHDPGFAPEETAELYGLYVHPRAWGRGLGKALCGRAVAELRARPYRELVLWVLEGNARARRFYQRLGFALDPGPGRPFTGFGVSLPQVRYRRAVSAPDGLPAPESFFHEAS